MNQQLNKKLRPLIGILLIATIIFYYAGLNWGLETVGFRVLFNLMFVIALAIDMTWSIFKRQEMFLFLIFFLLTFLAAPTFERRDFIYNANYYSYMGLYANFSIFRLHLKYRNTWTLLGLIFIPLLAMAISFTAQTRSGLIFTLLINVLFWFWVNKPKIRHPIYSIFRKILLFLIAIFCVIQFIKIYSTSSIEKRISSTSTEEDRGALLKEAIEIFIDYPFTGVGLGNFKNYSHSGIMSHNTYAEALAEHGFFIGTLMILVFVLPFLKSFKLFMTNKANSEYKLSLLFFFIFLIFNNIYVFYKATSAMMFFFLMIGVHYKLAESQKQVE